MKGILHYIDWSKLIDKPLETALRKYSLKREEPEVIFSNQKYSIKFWDSDYQAFNWVFYDPNAEHVYYYNVVRYAKYVLSSNISRWTNINKVDTLEEFTIETFKYYNDIMIEYLERPFNGDFSWHETYIEKYKVDLKLINYAYSTTNAHSDERRGITKSFRRSEEGSKKALLDHLSRNYSNNGKEFEVHHEDSSIHQLMVKFELKVPFYFSYNSELYMVVKRSNKKDFGQVYWFSKKQNKFLTPLRCDFAIQSKFERIEILTKQEFDKIIEIMRAKKRYDVRND